MLARRSIERGQGHRLIPFVAGIEGAAVQVWIIVAVFLHTIHSLRWYDPTQGMVTKNRVCATLELPYDIFLGESKELRRS